MRGNSAAEQRIVFAREIRQECRNPKIGFSGDGMAWLGQVKSFIEIQSNEWDMDDFYVK